MSNMTIRIDYLPINYVTTVSKVLAGAEVLPVLGGPKEP